MKRLFILLCILQSAFCTLTAQDYQLRAAIKKAVFSDKLLTANSFSNSGFDELASGELRRWSVLQYEFSVKESDATVFEPVMKAFEKNRRNKRTTTFVKTEPSARLYSFQFSAQHPAINVGSQVQERALLIIVGDEKPGQNTVIAMEAWKNDDAINGNFYIIERDPYFKQLATQQEKQKRDQGEFAIANGMINDYLDDVSENVRRLIFYSQKYEREASNFGGSAIVKATVYVVSDIIQTGSEEDRKIAKQVIDFMIMSTQSEKPQYPDHYNQIIRENSSTLINLLTRLDAKTEYSADMKSTPNTFRINGMIDEELWDIGYYISMSDDTMGDPTQDVELVKAEGQAFHYQTELDGIRLGRVRALMKDGTVCSAWIELLFVPGETAELTVHNGHYSLSGTGFYRDWNDAHNTFAWASGPSSLPDDKRDKAFLDILREHTDRPAFFVYAFKQNILRLKETRQKAYDLLPKETKESPYGVFLRKYL